MANPSYFGFSRRALVAALAATPALGIAAHARPSAAEDPVLDAIAAANDALGRTREAIARHDALERAWLAERDGWPDYIEVSHSIGRQRHVRRLYSVEEVRQFHLDWAFSIGGASNLPESRRLIDRRLARAEHKLEKLINARSAEYERRGIPQAEQEIQEARGALAVAEARVIECRPATSEGALAQISWMAEYAERVLLRKDVAEALARAAGAIQPAAAKIA